MLTYPKHIRGARAMRPAAADAATRWQPSARGGRATLAQTFGLIRVGFCPVVGRPDSRPVVGLAGLRQQLNSGRSQT
ncbi:MAG TPA: hypothetical protein VFX96_19825 [Pyrinomonadaceae bacterium]|nr:hypothetical protein [Pyrinomonadaceae bacterium]